MQIFDASAAGFADTRSFELFFVVYRLEEKEQEQKREYAKLHERYTELFKTHMDYMERTKILMGSAERLEGAARGRLPAVNLAQLNRCKLLTFNSDYKGVLTDVTPFMYAYAYVCNVCVCIFLHFSD